MRWDWRLAATGDGPHETQLGIDAHVPLWCFARCASTAASTAAKCLVAFSPFALPCPPVVVCFIVSPPPVSVSSHLLLLLLLLLALKHVHH